MGKLRGSAFPSQKGRESGWGTNKREECKRGKPKKRGGGYGRSGDLLLAAEKPTVMGG